MRLTPYIAALLVLSAAGTAIASHGADTSPTLRPGEPIGHTEEYNHDLYVQQGWWEASAISSDEVQETSNEGEWILLEEGRAVAGGDGITGAAEITVTAEGPVVAAMDVFKAYPSGQTPDCPQPLVTDKLPGDDFEDDPVAYPFDTADRADHHQRSATDQSQMTVTLDISSDESFYVAIYPQAVSAAASDSATETPEITWNISYVSQAQSSPDRPIDVDLNPRSQPDFPYEPTKWMSGLLIDLDCLSTGTGTTLGPDALPELPGQSPLDQRVTSMLDAQLPVD